MNRTPASRRLRWPATGLASVLSLVAVSAASADTRTFTNPGESPFTVPAGVTSLHVELVGGAGGDTNKAKGGSGRRVEADIPVKPGEPLFVIVGGNGADGRGGDGGGGGGASGLRLCSLTASSCPAGTNPLQSRLGIAGGGGGAGGSNEGSVGNGGDADHPADDVPTSPKLPGGAGTTYSGGKGGRGGDQGTDGTTDSGGRGGGSSGRGSGGSGGTNGGGDGGGSDSDGQAGGGAGGGYNGGGGGGADSDDEAGGGGGGGASWIVPTATKVQMTWTKARPSVTLTYTVAPTPPPVIPAPTVTGIAPTSGPVKGATTVTLVGSNFAKARRVLFGTTTAPRFALQGTTGMTVVVPPAARAGTVDVRVEGVGGLSAPSPAAKYTYVARSAPRPRPPTPRPPTPVPPPRPACMVPNLIGATLGTARKRLQRADCAVGNVRKPRRGRRLRVYRQGVAAGTHLVAGTQVSLQLRRAARKRSR